VRTRHGGGLRPVLTRPSDCLLTGLPDCLLDEVSSLLEAGPIAALSMTSKALHSAAVRAAEGRILQRRPYAAGKSCVCWLRCLASLRELEARVGPLPMDRSWRDENMAMLLKAESIMDPGWTSWDEDFMRQYLSAVQFVQGEEIQHKVSLGWQTEHAHCVVGMGGCDPAINWSLKKARGGERRRFAGSIHVYMDAVFMSALVGPPVVEDFFLYASLAVDRYSLVHPLIDEIYSPQALRRLGVGGSAVVSAGAANRASRWNFPNDRGMYTADAKEGIPGRLRSSSRLLEGDILCFRCAPADSRGFHALVRNPRPEFLGSFREEDEYLLPPLATITLERIDPPGTWQVLGHRVKRWLYTVSVTFGS